MTAGPRAQSVVERHLQTGLAALMVALAAWIGFTVQQTSVTVAKLEERMAYMAAQVQMMDGGINERLREQERRLRILEGRTPPL